jgi:hypothetical protein
MELPVLFKVNTKLPPRGLLECIVIRNLCCHLLIPLFEYGFLIKKHPVYRFASDKAEHRKRVPLDAEKAISSNMGKRPRVQFYLRT